MGKMGWKLPKNSCFEQIRSTLSRPLHPHSLGGALRRSTAHNYGYLCNFSAILRNLAHACGGCFGAILGKNAQNPIEKGGKKVPCPSKNFPDHVYSKFFGNSFIFGMSANVRGPKNTGFQRELAYRKFRAIWECIYGGDVQIRKPPYIYIYVIKT